MKITISYFAQLRNFKPNMVPISTAVYDPKWFHDNKGNDYKFIDKKGVLNGVRCRNLAPNSECSKLCKGRVNCEDEPECCLFLKKYKEQLDVIDKEKFCTYCDTVAISCSSVLHVPVDELTLVFMVYEKYDNPCSERECLLNFLNSCGYCAKELHYPIV